MQRLLRKISKTRNCDPVPEQVPCGKHSQVELELLCTCFLLHYTICTKDKRLYFGHIKNEAMDLSEIGAVADVFWKEIPSHHKDVELDDFIVMPNHVHGIIGICGPEPEFKLLSREKKPLISPRKGSLGVVLRSYKAAVSRWCTQNGVAFAWQPRYYDRIIRSPKSMAAVRKYRRTSITRPTETLHATSLRFGFPY